MRKYTIYIRKHTRKRRGKADLSADSVGAVVRRPVVRVGVINTKTLARTNSCKVVGQVHSFREGNKIQLQHRILSSKKTGQQQHKILRGQPLRKKNQIHWQILRKLSNQKRPIQEIGRRHKRSQQKEGRVQERDEKTLRWNNLNYTRTDIINL